MKKVQTSSVLFFLLFLIACSGSKKDDAAVVNSVETSLPAADSTSDQTVIAVPDSSAVIPVAVPQQAATATAAPVAEGMNPAHGEPGHRCDIPVGSPLNSPPGAKSDPGQPSASPVQISAPPVSAPVQTSSAPTAPGMNPPHGQPGHDCSVPVGSPLKK